MVLVGLFTCYTWFCQWNAGNSGISYYSEVTSPGIRTAVHCMAGVFNCFAILLPVVFVKFGFNWRLLCYIGAVIPVLGFIHIQSVPESPAWLVMRGKLKEALRAILTLS